MISLNEYKNYLINTYSWSIDNSEELALKRKKVLEKKYSDEFLSKVISNSYEFARSVLDDENINYGYYKSDVLDDTTSYINLGLHGGWMSDTLYVDSEGRYISTYIIKTIFGRSIMLELRTEEVEREVEDGMFTFDYNYYIYMQGFSKDLGTIGDSITPSKMKLTKHNNSVSN
mgnify:CR=1 FL=1